MDAPDVYQLKHVSLPDVMRAIVEERHRPGAPWWRRRGLDRFNRNLLLAAIDKMTAVLNQAATQLRSDERASEQTGPG